MAFSEKWNDRGRAPTPIKTNAMMQFDYSDISLNWGNSSTMASPAADEPLQLFNKDTLQQRLKKLINNARESWTYGIFWESFITCGTDSTVLKWGDGYYKGEMKNTIEEEEYQKKVFPDLLSYLYILDDEDVTNTEWFFRNSMTHSFGYGCGLPGEAMSTNKSITINGREQMLASHCERTQKGPDSGLQTIVCIPCTNGVVELGSTQLTNLSIGLVNEVRGLFGFINSPQDLTPMEADKSIPCPNGVAESASFIYRMSEARIPLEFIKSQPDLTPVKADHTDGCDNDPSKRRCKTTRISIPQQVIEKQFGKTMKAAAKNLNVSESTFKRKLRELDIKKWPGPKRNRSDLSVIQINTIEENTQDPSTVSMNKNLLTIIIKAEYADDMIKFCLPSSQEATFVTLEKEISKEFSLNLGTYKLKYLDEDEDWISLRSEVEMSDCIKSSTKSGRIVIRLRVVPSL